MAQGNGSAVAAAAGAVAAAEPSKPLAGNDLLAEIDRLRAENAKLAAKVQAGPRLSLKVSAKGALSVYGLGRFPVTLYQGQWERLLGMSAQISAFIAANKATLSQGKE